MDTEKSANLESFASLWLSFIWITLMISFFLAIMQGSLVLTWLFINSLQLIAHVPLITARLPANVNIVLERLLGFTRLSFDGLSEALDTPDSIISAN